MQTQKFFNAEQLKAMIASIQQLIVSLKDGGEESAKVPQTHISLAEYLMSEYEGTRGLMMAEMWLGRCLKEMEVAESVVTDQTANPSVQKPDSANDTNATEPVSNQSNEAQPQAKS